MAKGKSEPVNDKSEGKPSFDFDDLFDIDVDELIDKETLDLNRIQARSSRLARMRRKNPSNPKNSSLPSN